jgi:hypothetical protein
MNIIRGFYMECVYFHVANNFINNNSLRQFQVIDVNIPIIEFNFCFSLVTWVWVSTFSILVFILGSDFQLLFFV